MMLRRVRRLAFLTGLLAAGYFIPVLAQNRGGNQPPPTPSSPLPWAYPLNTPGAPAPPPDDGSPKHVPGSTIALTLPQTRDLFNIPDWHPDDHPPLPDVVQHGRRPDVRACGYCHLPNGLGRPENCSVAGLPAAYIVHADGGFQERRAEELGTENGPAGGHDRRGEGGQ